ncbi:MAG: phosphate-starvation-inducible PsiE family protein [Methyloprofundus sp.]|nr:phosphate-starvation-inducible PsiE family protein [Methyloprofundus sp.]MBW6453207.1 phosphate-starvation-inducible PsiE family protein [Methyloprofundus sp.]
MDNRSRSIKSTHEFHEELPAEHEDNFIKVLHGIIHFAVRILAVLMVAVILWGVADVVLVMYNRLMAPPFMLLNVSDILAMFSTFLVVLIAIEIFLNITLYIRKDVLPIKLVVATALMAVSRKIIVFDFNQISPLYIFATATVVLALGITYWLISLKPKQADTEHRE